LVQQPFDPPLAAEVELTFGQLVELGLMGKSLFGGFERQIGAGGRHPAQRELFEEAL
jgi:hypothetical protein